MVSNALSRALAPSGLFGSVKGFASEERCQRPETGAELAWIQYEFDRIYTRYELWVRSFNQIIEPSLGFGAKIVKIEYSTDSTTWAPVANVPEFAHAPGQDAYVHNTTVSFGGVSAKFVKLTIEKNWGVAPQTGLSEVRFFAIQTAAVKP
jgi:hypothetical protein